jgi:hypothetical protein
MIGHRSSSAESRASSRLTSGAFEVRPRRAYWAILLAPALICTAAIAVKTWDGKGTDALALHDAAHISQDRNQPEAKRKLAALSLQRMATEAIEALRGLAADNGPAGVQARSSLDHLRSALEPR